MAIEYRPFGGTGIKVSRYCLGAMMFGAMGNRDEAECVRIAHAALDAGINFVDTADAYSGGESERILAKALQGRREKVVLATKCFFPTGRDVNGGYAEFMTVPAAYAYPIPEIFSDAEAAPLLCAGAIGYRALRLTNLQNGQPLGLTGFGGSAHLVIQLARHRFPDSPVYVFARDPESRAFALELGAVWAGETTERAPEPLRRDVVVAVAPAEPVDGDPLRLAEHREAEDAVPLREVRAQRVGRAHGRVRRDQGDRARRRLGPSGDEVLPGAELRRPRDEAPDRERPEDDPPHERRDDHRAPRRRQRCKVVEQSQLVRGV